MREIKFRVWNKPGGFWYEPHRIRMDMDGKLTVWICQTDPNAPLFTPNYEMCQYTGLKDRSGVEIYEGDIVRLIYGPKFYLYAVSDDCGCDLKRIIDESGGSQEVIGNIYENPELVQSSGHDV